VITGSSPCTDDNGEKESVKSSARPSLRAKRSNPAVPEGAGSLRRHSLSKTGVNALTASRNDDRLIQADVARGVSKHHWVKRAVATDAWNNAVIAALMSWSVVTAKYKPGEAQFCRLVPILL
jgi:hypothetical protein